MKFSLNFLVFLLLLAALGASGRNPEFKVAEGFVVEPVAGASCVERPMLASFDDQGRLYVADSAGVNLKGAELLKNPPHSIRMLTDTRGDGYFDTSSVFADKMVFPQGVAWHNGSVYVSSPPHFWRLQDTDGDGRADKRQILATGFALTGVSDDMHGGSLGPDGRIYWFAGRFPHEIRNPGGPIVHRGTAPLMLRCQPDGSELEVVCGAQGNGVGAAFTREGEAFACGTFYAPRSMGAGLRDAIIHCIEGAEYPVLDRVLHEHKRTGELMPPLTHLGVAAAAGLAIYRGGNFGTNYEGNLFSALFNMHKIMRHVLEREGATFKCHNEDFLVSDDPDFHPTDVLEDADGSLLVLDTGGWFRIGCPTSQIAKPEVKGAIYRIRRKDAATIADPRGLQIKWPALTSMELAGLLSDARFAVRDRAIQQLANAGTNSVPTLKNVLIENPSVEARRNAIWGLTRIGRQEARTAARLGLTDRSASVRQTAAYSAGLLRDLEAVPQLMKIVSADFPPVRREAASALGRIRSAAAVPALLEGLRFGGDRFLEHALIFALIQINDRASVLKGLADKDAAVRRGSLIALDQMDGGDLTPELAMPFLNPADPSLQQTALWVVAHHPEWGGRMLAVFQQWLAGGDLDERQRENLKQQLLAFCQNASIQNLLAERLGDEKAPVPTRLILLETIAQAPLNEWPPGWGQVLKSNLTNSDERIVRQSIAAIRSAPLDKRPVVKRVDPQIDFPSSTNRFGATRLIHNFYARWTGVIEIQKDGNYIFATESDDGSRLFMDGRQIVDNGGFHLMQSQSGETELKAGPHEIKIEFFQGEGPSGCRVFWQPGDAAKEIIPAAALFHHGEERTGAPGTGLDPGLLGEYYDTSGGAAGFLDLHPMNFETSLLQLVSNPALSTEVHVEALAAAAPRLIKLPQPQFEFLLACLEKPKLPLMRMAAAGALSGAPLEKSQLLDLARVLPAAGALEVSKLLSAFSRSREVEVGKALLTALQQSAMLESLPAGTLRKTFEQYPITIQQAAEPLLNKVTPDLQKQTARLAELKPALSGGQIQPGRELFFGNKAACSACHAIQGKGGRVGPDLSKIGVIRSAPDLLEAIVFPSASFARGFEPYLITTKDGEIHSGIIARETAEGIDMYDGARIETRIPRSNIKEIRPGSVSVMPAGLDVQLSKQELGDLISFLHSLR